MTETTTKVTIHQRLAALLALCFGVLSFGFILSVGYRALTDRPAAPDGIVDSLPAGISFSTAVIGGKSLSFAEHTIGSAYVEKDLLVYQNEPNGRYRLVRSRWTKDVPERLPGRMLRQSDAEAIARSVRPGRVEFARLLFVAKDSDVFASLNPKPANPVWSVAMRGEDGSQRILAVDAVLGTVIGEGVPPPSQSLAFTGPQSQSPCAGAWTLEYSNAQSTFSAMGYAPQVAVWPAETTLAAHLSFFSTSLYYHLAHGDSTGFESGCLNGTAYQHTTASEIASWMSSAPKLPFAFIGSCDGMCSTGPGTLSDAFRKSSTVGTATVGFCGMGGQTCQSCWASHYDWQRAFMEKIAQGRKVKSAFTYATEQFPICDSCTRFAGDENLELLPVVHRGPWIDLTKIGSYDDAISLALTVDPNGTPAELEMRYSQAPYSGDGWWANATDITPSEFAAWTPGSRHEIGLDNLAYGIWWITLRQKPTAQDSWQDDEQVVAILSEVPQPGQGGSPVLVKFESDFFEDRVRE